MSCCEGIVAGTKLTSNLIDTYMSSKRSKDHSDVGAEQLDQVVRRIVEAVAPLRIILFGSAARGDAGRDSDFDILVVMPDGANRRETTQFLHTRMFGIPVAVDIVVATMSDLERHRNNIGLIYGTVLEEGKELYAA